MLPNLASEYLNTHKLLSKIEDALNTCIASNLDSPESYIASVLMQMSPGPCTINKIMLLPTGKILYCVCFCETFRSFIYQLKPGSLNKLITICLSAVSVSSLSPNTVREFLPSLSLSSTVKSVTPSTGSRAQSSQKNRAKSDLKEDAKQYKDQEKYNPPDVSTYEEPLFFDESIKTPLHGINIFERINVIWPLLLKNLGGDRELAVEVYDHIFDISLQILSSSRMIELRRRATNVSTLTMRCPTPIFAVFSWNTILNISLVPIGNSLLSFQALIHELNAYVTNVIANDNANGANATKKKTDAVGLPPTISLFPFLLKQDPGLQISSENPTTMRILELKDDYFEMSIFNNVKPSLKEKTTGSQTTRPSDKLRKYFSIVAIFHSLINLLQKVNEDWRKSAKVQMTVDLSELLPDMKCTTANADDVLRDLKEKIDAIYPNCRSITPNYSSMVSFINSFETYPLVSEFESFMFNILLAQRWGALNISFINCKIVPDESVSIEYYPDAEAAKQEATQAVPKKGGKQQQQQPQSTSGAIEESKYKPPIVYQSYSKEAVARQVLTAMTQHTALSEISRQTGKTCPEEATVSLSLFFDHISLVNTLNTKLSKYFPTLSNQVKASTLNYVKTPAICTLNQAEYLDAVCVHCHDLEPAKALNRPTKLMLHQGSHDSTTSAIAQTSMLSFRGGERQMGITPRAGSRFAGPGSQISISDQRVAACIGKENVSDTIRGLTRTTLPDETTSISKSFSPPEDVSTCEELPNSKTLMVSHKNNESTVLTMEVETVPTPQTGEDTVRCGTPKETGKEKGKEKDTSKTKDECVANEHSYINRVTCALIYGYEGLYINNITELDELVEACMYLKSDGRLV